MRIFSVLASCSFLLLNSCNVEPERSSLTENKYSQKLSQEESQDASLERFLGDTGQALAMDQYSGGAHVSWNYSGAIKSLWVENGSFSFESLDCDENDPVAAPVG